MLVGAVAQLGERLVCNQEATGSIPVSSTRTWRMGRKLHEIRDRTIGMGTTSVVPLEGAQEKEQGFSP